MVNNLSPKTEPCGTPGATGRLREIESKHIFLYSMYDWNHLNAIPLIPYRNCRIFRSTLRLIVSKEAERSRYAITLVDIKSISQLILTRTVYVKYTNMNADCIGAYIEYSLMCSSSVFATSFSIILDIRWRLETGP